MHRDSKSLLSGGDIYKKCFAKIAELCRTYSRSQAKVGRNLHDSLRDNASRNQKPASTTITRVELGNLLEDFKTDILNTIGNQLDTMKHKKKQEDERATMEISCPRSRQKHMEREFPINSIEGHGICALEHATGKCPSLPGLQTIYKGNVETNDPSQASKKPFWRGPNQNMFPEPSPQGYSQTQHWNFQPAYPLWAAP